jgi:hypothetical protein
VHLSLSLSLSRLSPLSLSPFPPLSLSLSCLSSLPFLSSLSLSLLSLVSLSLSLSCLFSPLSIFLYLLFNHSLSLCQILQDGRKMLSAVVNPVPNFSATSRYSGAHTNTQMLIPAATEDSFQFKLSIVNSPNSASTLIHLVFAREIG